MAENILHFGGIRLRVNGVGNLQMELLSLDDDRSVNLKELPITPRPGLEPTRRVNFKSQRTRLKIFTTKMNEYAKVNRIIIFAKQSSTSFPM